MTSRRPESASELLQEPFPQLTAWAEKNLSGKLKQEFHEYLCGVKYHLSHAEEASRECSSALWNFQWAASKSGVFVLGLSPERLVFHGDTALREATSAIDTALMLVNHVLSLGVKQRRIRWGPPTKEGPLRNALRAVPNKEASDLVTAIDSVFNSIGYQLLQGYRNWITHRGAPSAIASPELSGPMPMPEEAITETESGKKDWLIETHLRVTVPSKIVVQCWPFVPPVQTIVNATIDNPETDVEFFGIKIAKGAGKIQISDMRVVSGNLAEDAQTYMKQNPILLDNHRVTVAGEELAVYAAMDYTQAVGSVVRFATSTLTGKWDSDMTQLCGVKANQETGVKSHSLQKP